MSLHSQNKDCPFPPLKDSTLRVYSMRFCPFAQRARLVMQHKNVPYEEININLGSKPDWFLERNPGGTVPTLEKDGVVIYESTATSEWVDDVYPGPRLAPSDPLIKAQDRMLLEYSGKLSSAMFKVIGKGVAEDTALVDDVHKHYKHYEGFLAKRKGPFFGGASPSLLDFFVWPFYERLAAHATIDKRVGVNEKDYPALARWYTKMYELPAVKAIGHSVETLNNFVKTYAAGTPDYDYGL